MFMLGSALIHVASSKANQDFWVSYLAVIIITLFMFFVYSRIFSLFPQKNMLDIHKFLFGKIIGSIIYGSYVFYAFSLGVFVTRHFTEFIQITSLPETPQYAFAICIILLSIYIVKQGIETLGRWSLFTLPFIILIFLFTMIFSAYLFNPGNLKPLFQSDFSLIADSTFNSYSLPFGESVIFLLLLDSLQNSKKTLKAFYISMAIGVTIIILAVFRNILVLGVENNKLLVSASVSAVSIIQIRSFVERIEVIITIIFIICGLSKVAVCLMGACKGTAKLLKLDSYRPLSVPLGLLMLMLSFNVFESLMHITEWFNVYRVFFLPIQILFPLAAWITAEIKIKLQKKHTVIKKE
jgi:spore germination protein KB